MAAAVDPPDHELVDLDSERARRGGAYQMPCPKCGNRMYVHGQRCSSCGTWFEGAAFAYASRESLFAGRSRALRTRKAAVLLAIVLGLAIIVVLVVTVIR